MTDLGIGQDLLHPMTQQEEAKDDSRDALQIGGEHSHDSGSIG